MKPPLIPRSPARRERGITMVLVAIAMVAIVGMAALSIDVITLYLAREEAQRSADQAALAAARIISTSGMTGDPGNSSAPSSWFAVCGGVASPATQAAIAVGMQNSVGNTVANNPPLVNYFDGTVSSADCSTLGTAFGVNPQITVQITRANLPTFFSRIWGNTGNQVSATATAEAFNPSNSGNVGITPSGEVVPVQPTCVKPWIVPNRDPLFPNPTAGFCSPTNGTLGNCRPLVSVVDGSIQHPGITLNGLTAATYPGIIGETFWLVPNCSNAGATCGLLINPPQANYFPTPLPQPIPPRPNLLYLPGQAVNPPVAVPSCANVGFGSSADYEPVIGGCDQSTQYQCGVAAVAGNPPFVDLTENPSSSGDTTNGVQCLIHEGNPADPPPNGQDSFFNYGAPPTFPFQIYSGANNPVISANTPITSSSSIVSLPIYDDGAPIATAGTTSVTIVGFLQVFINSVDQWGDLQVTILNVSGCGNGSGGGVSGSAVTGSSPVPIRLVTPP